MVNKTDNKPLVSIVIVNYNGREYLSKCLKSILENNYEDYEIIVMDNNSSDDSCDFVESNCKENISIRIIRNKKNFGFGKANNLGVKFSKGEIIFFLNNDTILANKTLEKLLQYKQNNNLNIITPKIVDYNKRDIYEGKKLSVDCTGYLGWGEETFYVEGCALMISRNDFLKLGGFDEKYFMYSEDIDLCWRAHLYGMKLGVCEDTTIIHFGGGSSEKTYYQRGTKHVVPMFRRYEVEKNNLRNLLKNYRFINLIWIIPLVIIQDLFESFLYIFTGNFKMFKIIWKAIFWNITNIRDTLLERKKVQRSRIVGDMKILKKMSSWSNKLKAFLIVGLPKFKK